MERSFYGVQEMLMYVATLEMASLETMIMHSSLSLISLSCENRGVQLHFSD